MRLAGGASKVWRLRRQGLIPSAPRRTYSERRAAILNGPLRPSPLFLSLVPRLRPGPSFPEAPLHDHDTKQSFEEVPSQAEAAAGDGVKSTVSQDFSQQLVMARRKLDKTLADYLAIAVTPALIMVLIGSLVWFLAEIGYTGSRESRVRWILFWFVVGAVLVARIAMEQGRAQASIFLLGLAGATSLAIFKFASDGPLVPIICLGIVAWCADKLTWDCTLIDESEDASGEGLLQVAGVADEAELPAEYAGTDGSGNDSGQRDSGPRDSGDSADSGDGPDAGDGEGASGSSASAAASARGTPGRRQEKVPFWRRVFLNESERAGKPHAPGLWVVYFSLAALPIFGFGQTMIPETRPDSRHFAFRCLLAYVGAGLGLLMLTSFLGLRRYLRQRNLEMPPTMAATWGFSAAAGWRRHSSRQHLPWKAPATSASR